MKKETKKHIGNWSLNNLYESACKKLSRHIKKDVKYAQNLIDFILKNDQGLIHPDAVKKDGISNLSYGINNLLKQEIDFFFSVLYLIRNFL